MKKTQRTIAGWAAALALLGSVTAGLAATRTKASNTTALNAVGSWVEGTVPVTGDTALWDSTLPGANSSAIGGAVTAGCVKVTNPGGAVSITASSTSPLTLAGNSASDDAVLGINMTNAAQDLTIAAPIYLGNTQTWDVAAGRVLTVAKLTGRIYAPVTFKGGGSFAQSDVWGSMGGIVLDPMFSGTLTLNKANAATPGGIAMNTTNGGIVKVITAAGINNQVVSFASNSTGKVQIQNASSVTGLKSDSTSAIVENGHATTDYLLTVNNASDNTFAGVLRDGDGTTAGTLKLTKSGLGKLTLKGDNTFGGALTINGGILRAEGYPKALGTNTTALVLGIDFSELQLAGDSDIDFGRNISVTAGRSAFTVDRLTPGAGVTHTLGTLTLNNNHNRIRGGANVTNGTAKLQFGTVTFGGSGIFMLEEPPNGGKMAMNFSSPINGAGALYFHGPGTVDLTAVNGQGGAVYARNGVTLRLSGAGVLTNSTSCNLFGGSTLVLDNTAVNSTDRLKDFNCDIEVDNTCTVHFYHTGAAGTSYSEKMYRINLGSSNSEGGNVTLKTSQAANDGSTSTLTFLDTYYPLNLRNGGTILFSGAGFGVDSRNEVILASNKVDGAQGIVPYALIEDAGNYDLVASIVKGARITKYLAYDTIAGDPAWGAATNARPNGNILLTGDRNLNSLVLDDGINLSAPAADRTITLGSPIVQTGGSSTIGASGDNEYMFKAKWQGYLYVQTIGTLTMERGNGNPITVDAGYRLIKSGSGTWNLGSAATPGFAMSMSGAFYINEGTVRVNSIDSTNALGSGNGTLILNSSARLEIADDAGVNLGRNTSVYGDTTIVSDTLTSDHAGAVHTLGTLSMKEGKLTITNGSHVSANSPYGIAFGDTTLAHSWISPERGNVFDVGPNGTLTLGAIKGNYYPFEKLGAGTLKLATTATRTDGNTWLWAGTLRLETGNALCTKAQNLYFNGGTLSLRNDVATNFNGANIIVGGSPVNVTVDAVTPGTAGKTHTVGTLRIGAQTLNVSAGSAFQADTPYGLTCGAVTLVGNPTLCISNNGTGVGTLTLGAITGSDGVMTLKGAGNLAQSGVWSGTSSQLILDGTYLGTATLGQVNTYTGPTTVNGGALLVTNSLSSPVTVGGNGRVGGIGPLNAGLTANSGGCVAPGGSVGVLTVANGLTLNAGAALEFEFDNPYTTNDLINVTDGLVAINGAVGVYLYAAGGTARATLTEGQTYKLIKYNAGTPETSNLYVANPAPAKAYTFELAGGYVQLNVAAGPATGTVILIR